MQEENWSARGKSAEASLDRKQNAHSMPGPGIEPETHWCKGREVPLHYLLPLIFTCFCRWAGHICLNLNFSAKFPRGLHMIFKLRIKKSKLDESDAQNYFNRKYVEVQPFTSLKIILNGLCF